MMVKRGDLRRYSYPYPNDFGKSLAWCLAYDIVLIRDFIRYAFEDQRAGKPPITEG